MSRKDTKEKSMKRLDTAFGTYGARYYMVRNALRKLTNGERMYLKHVLETEPSILWDESGVSTVEASNALVALMDEIGLDEIHNVTSEFKVAIATIHDAYRTMKKNYSVLNDAEFGLLTSKYETKTMSPKRCPLSNVVISEIENAREENNKDSLVRFFGT